MPIQIIRQDITRIPADAIVNPTNESLIPGGGVDEAIHRAAGKRLDEACARLGGCELGQVQITPGFDLPCKYVIHTVGPVWRGGKFGERALLEACYLKSLRLARKYRCRSIAFPLISSGTFGYPKDRVLRVAADCIREFLDDYEMTVYIAVYDKESYQLSEELYSGVVSYIDDNYTAAECPDEPVKVRREREKMGIETESVPDSLEEVLGSIGKGFAETLFGYIDDRGLTDVECYKCANVDRKTFSKIKCSKTYRPGKATVLSFAVALRLTLDETNRLLNTVGMSLSHSSRFDLIVEYFIQNGRYDIFEINETLFKFDQPLLGA